MPIPLRWLAVAALLLPLLALPRGALARQESPRRIGGEERVQVNLVLIDVVVRDRKDRPVSGLTLDDFQLLVDRLPVDPAEIETFEEICPAVDAGSAPRAEQPAGESAPPQPAASPRHIVLLFDFSHLSFSGRQQALRGARDFLAQGTAPGDRVMILAFKKSLRLVQDFTSSSELLAARLEDLIVDTSTVDTDVIEETRNLASVVSAPCDPQGSECTRRRMLAQVYATQEQQRARRTIEAIQGLMPALSGLKGRKALVLFTDVFREDPGIQYVAAARSTPESEGIMLEHEYLGMTREANAAGVSFYTVHAAGLDDSSLEAFRDARSQTEQFSMGGTGGAELKRQTLGTNYGDGYEAARTGLDSALALQTMLAVETGGRALQRTNDVGAILGSARQDLSCYYLLGYRFASRGDNARHSLLVKLTEDDEGRRRRGVEVRHRPYFIDYSPADRRRRILSSAMQAPQLYHGIPLIAEAFAFPRSAAGQRVLVKAMAPLKSLSLLPADESWLEGSALIQGNVSADGRTACEFQQDFPLRIARDGQAPSRLVFETGCILDPGSYELAVALLDPATRELGAIRSPLIVPAPPGSGAAFVSDIHLWVRDPDQLLVAAGAEQIGVSDTGGTTGFVPMAERRIRSGQEAMLSFMLCPPSGSHPDATYPIRLRRTLHGEADARVAQFRDLTITDPPDAGTGCYQVFSQIPAGTLGSGIYRFDIDAVGAPLGGPISRQIGLAVD